MSRHGHLGEVVRQWFQDSRFAWQGAFHDVKFPTLRFITTIMGIHITTDFQFKDSTQIKYRLDDNDLKKR